MQMNNFGNVHRCFKIDRVKMDDTIEANFTQEQKDKLDEIQKDALKLSETKTRLSKLLGIPKHEIVSPNLFRAASLFGLLSKDSGDNVFSLLFPQNTKSRKYKNYKQYPLTSEKAKLQSLQKILSVKTSKFTQQINTEVKKRTEILEENEIYIATDDYTFQGFQNACIDTMESIAQALEECNQEDAWVITHLRELRKAVFGFIDMVSCIKIARQHYLLAKRCNLHSVNCLTEYEQLVLGLSFTHYVNPEVIQQALFIDYYVRDPKVVPFSIQHFIKKCCTPALMFCKLEKVLEFGLLNPYHNNNIGYHRGSKLFYILYSVDGKNRYWVADPGLVILASNLGGKLSCFLRKTFRQLFYAIFQTNEFRSTYHHPRHEEFKLLIRNWRIAQNLPLLVNILKSYTVEYAEIYATDLDKFNITDMDGLETPKLGIIQCKNLYDPFTDLSLEKLE